MPIQQIESGSTQGWQIRIVRNGRTIRTLFLAYRKHGGKKAAYRLAKKQEAALNKEVNQLLGPSIRANNAKGKHFKHPASNNRSGIPGISMDYHAGGGRHPSLTVHVRWMEGEKPNRKQHHTSFSVDTHGLPDALQLALDKRQEKTGIKQPSALVAWEKLRSSVLEQAVQG